MQIFIDPRKYGGKGHGGSVDRGRGLSCDNAIAHLIGWPIRALVTCTHADIIAFIIGWKTNAKILENCEDIARVVRSFYWLKTHREDFDKMRW